MDERQNLGMLTSPLLTQERDKCSPIQDLSYSKKKHSESRSSPVPTSTVRPVAMHSHKGKSSRDSKDLQESYSSTGQILEDTPPVLPLRKFCEDHGYSNESTSGRKPHLIKNGRNIQCNTENDVSTVVLGLSTAPSQLVCEYILNICIAGLNGR